MELEEMSEITEQMKKWAGEFGEEYTDRMPFLWKRWKLYIRETMG